MKFVLGTYLDKIKIILIHKAASFFLVSLIKNKIVPYNLVNRARESKLFAHHDSVILHPSFWK